MACLPAAPSALDLRKWLGLGLFVLLCLHLGSLFGMNFSKQPCLLPQDLCVHCLSIYLSPSSTSWRTGKCFIRACLWAQVSRLQGYRFRLSNTITGVCYGLEKKTVNSKVGESISLPCCHEIPSSESLQNYRVYWQKNTTEVVLAYDYGRKMPTRNRYENKTEMNTSNLTLMISAVEILDNGSYQCVVLHRRSSQNSVVCDESNLFVTADFSKPNITAEVFAESCESTEMVVRCSSYGGFPKPKISGVLNNESVVWNTSWVSEGSFSPYNVTGELWLNVTKEDNITCSIEYNGFAKSTSLLLKNTNKCIVPTVPPPYNVITASSIIIVISLLAITLAARCFSRHACSRCYKAQDTVEEGEKECMKPTMSSKVTSEAASV